MLLRLQVEEVLIENGLYRGWEIIVVMLVIIVMAIGKHLVDTTLSSLINKNNQGVTV